MMKLENLLKKHNIIRLILIILVLGSFILTVFGKLNDIYFWGTALVAFVFLQINKKQNKK